MNFAKFIAVQGGGHIRTVLTPPIATEREFKTAEQVKISGKDYVVVEGDVPRVSTRLELADGRIVDGLLRSIRVVALRAWTGSAKIIEAGYYWPEKPLNSGRRGSWLATSSRQ